MKIKSSNSIRGVTLVEIAIVLVIIGLLLGGILKGQELINNAKVRSIADRQNSLKVAWFAFIDRFQALPGDYVYAAQYIPGATNGEGNGLITQKESPVVFQHLTGSGYLRCPQCTVKTLDQTPSARNSLQNQYGGVMAIFHDATYYAAKGGQNSRLLIHTAHEYRVTSYLRLTESWMTVSLIPVIFAFNSYDAGGSQPAVGNCLTTSQASQVDGSLDTETNTWYRHANATPPVEQNCGGSVAI